MQGKPRPKLPFDIKQSHPVSIKRRFGGVETGRDPKGALIESEADVNHGQSGKCKQIFVQVPEIPRETEFLCAALAGEKS